MNTAMREIGKMKKQKNTTTDDLASSLSELQIKQHANCRPIQGNELLTLLQRNKTIYGYERPVPGHENFHSAPSCSSLLSVRSSPKFKRVRQSDGSHFLPRGNFRVTVYAEKFSYNTGFLVRLLCENYHSRFRVKRFDMVLRRILALNRTRYINLVTRMIPLFEQGWAKFSTYTRTRQSTRRDLPDARSGSVSPKLRAFRIHSHIKLTAIHSNKTGSSLILKIAWEKYWF